MPVTTAIRKRRQAYRQAVAVDVSSIRFTQPSIKDTFSNGAPLSWTIHMLKTGQIKPREIPLIRIGCVDNHWRTIDNRRLYCFKSSCIDKVPAIVMQDIKEEFTYKNQSYTDGLSIHLIHQPPANIDHNQMIMAYDPETTECRRWKIVTVIQQTKELNINKQNINKHKPILSPSRSHPMYYHEPIYNQSHYGNYYRHLSQRISAEIVINKNNMRRYNSDSKLLQIKKNKEKIDDDDDHKTSLLDDIENIQVNNNENNFIKADVFSTLNQLKHKYNNQKDVFFSVLHQYIKQYDK